MSLPGPRKARLLEVEAQSKLSDARIAYGIVVNAEWTCRRSAKRRVVDDKVGMVEQVEEIRPELDAVPFLYWKIFRNEEIPILLKWRTHLRNIATEVAKDRVT